MPERLIDANALMKRVCEKECGPHFDINRCDLDDDSTDTRCVFRDYVRTAPTIEAEPVRHGRWIEKLPYEDETVKDLEFQIVCSRCDEQNSSITFDENSVPIEKTFYRTRYCPNCGAKMDLTELPKGAE